MYAIRSYYVPSVHRLFNSIGKWSKNQSAVRNIIPEEYLENIIVRQRREKEPRHQKEGHDIGGKSNSAAEGT